MTDDPSQFLDPRVMDDEALLLAREDPSDTTSVEVLTDEGIAALDAYDETERPALLAFAIHILDCALDRADDRDEHYAHLAATLGDACRMGAAVFDSRDLLACAADAYRTAAQHPRLDVMPREVVPPWDGEPAER